MIYLQGPDIIIDWILILLAISFSVCLPTSVLGVYIYLRLWFVNLVIQDLFIYFTPEHREPPRLVTSYSTHLYLPVSCCYWHVSDWQPSLSADLIYNTKVVTRMLFYEVITRVTYI